MGSLSKERKWVFLTLSARWDRADVDVPIFKASARGRPVPLLKTLTSSYCVNQCAYCALRAGRRATRARWSPEDLAQLAFKLWREGVIEGVFLSSAIDGDPDRSMEAELEVAERLRGMGFNSYIHLRVMPGCGRHLIQRAVELANRVGVNLEAPAPSLFNELCPDKGGYRVDLIKRLEWCVEEAEAARRRGFRVDVDTQLVVGALEDDDLSYLRLTQRLYESHVFRRVYFSGFEPVKATPLESKPPCPRLREAALYQASFLLRDYGFTMDDLKPLLDDRGMLPRGINLKLAYAKLNQNLYPVDINEARPQDLLKVPGIGPRSAQRLVKLRSLKGKLTELDVSQILGAGRFRKARRFLAIGSRRLEEFA